MVTGSKELIRDINSHLVLEYIINHPPISRASLAKELGLTKATISAIVQELLDKHLILEIGSKDTKKGRKPILLTFNQNSGYVISLEISTDSITVLTSNLKGENCQIKQYTHTCNEDNVLTILSSILKKTLNSLPHSEYGAVGASIGIHGVVYNRKIMFSPHYKLENIDISTYLEKELSIPIYIENEANLSVLGEHAFHHDSPHMINLSIHSGIGMGIIINHDLYTGANGYAGEFGHTIILPNGRPCPCGNNGCLEQYASERSILSALATLKGVPAITLDQMLELYYNGDLDALAVIEEFIEYLSLGINNILNTFNPNLIIINSSFTMNIPNFTESLEKKLNNRMNAFCTIIPSKLQDTAILLGGAFICAKNFLGINSLYFDTKK